MIHIFDTTLRDGEQSPGISLNLEEKVEISSQLERLGVSVIEAGFPVTSPGDFQAVQEIARNLETASVCALARTHKSDIDAAWRALSDAAQPRIHTFISTSDIHITHQLKSDREDVLGQARAAVATAKAYCDDVEFSPMDATRSQKEFLVEVCQAAIEEGATVINIPDTVGYTTPQEYSLLLKYLQESLPELGDSVELSVHCHNDLGLAVANSYAGVLAGATQVECAINGLGERAGNCALEEIVMLLKSRGGEDSLRTDIITPEIAKTSRMVSRYTGYHIQPNKAVVGKNAFAHESGIHQDGVLKHRSTYEILDPADVGLESNQIVIGKHSGRHALQDALSKLGFNIEGQELIQAFKRFKEIADKKKQVTAMDLEAIVSDQARDAVVGYQFKWYEVEAGTSRSPSASVVVEKPGREEALGEGTGDGPVDAVFQAIQNATQIDCELLTYSVEAITEGEDALAEAVVVLKAGDNSGSGQGVSTDVVEASARAYVRALSNAQAKH